MDAPKPRQRRKALLIVPVVAVLAVVAFLYLVSSTASPANVASTARAEPVAPAADETEAAPLPSAGEATPGDQPPAPTAEMAAPVEAAAEPVDTATEPLAIVNGAALAPREFDEAIAIDAVMATLAGQAPTSPALLLEQLINTRLVLQAAGSNLPAIDTAAYLAAMLQAYGRDSSALDQALTAASIERERFDLYFSQVAIADALVRAQQAATGQSAGDYIRTLQQQAQISFGGEEDGLSINSLAGRQEIWSRALYAIQDFPLTGTGPGLFRELVPPLYPLFRLSSDKDIAHAHNQWLQTALDFGLPGLIAYLALWLGLVGCLWRTGRSPLTPLQRNTLYGLAATLTGYFAYGLFDTIALGARPGFIFWTLVGLVLGLHNAARSGAKS